MTAWMRPRRRFLYGLSESHLVDESAEAYTITVDAAADRTALETGRQYGILPYSLRPGVRP